ncbi:magnesium transporter NIPA-domain-containing protein [Protomyces lactucae-debilis]|uniref:Magnesium transporter NIPA-domain-containing protein n=1 Tax=Protomyces lactucae-debilis TaxID=2754530 RepID=A0A1Y2F437_PROLT|nr:magnesium transporter NIPA-domain-containing protein [Protomyces lactucae-debilis]ORY78641.1 magnesium transporter NIPA-domain-containing protein [Protomyces lactucae-debilis]
MGNKIVGIVLAVCSGLFIGVSFVIKKKGLLKATEKSGNMAGEGYAYLKSWIWWTGMTLMIVGECCNFIAYAFTEAILVTPLGALAVVVSAIGSSIFLKERLSFVGKIGCALTILGAVIIVLNSPEQVSATTIQQVKHFAISKVFLPYCAIVLGLSAFLILWAGPRYGQTHIMVYISICSLIGGISVVCTQGFGASVVSAIGGTPNQWNNWFLWVLFIFVIITLLFEIVYLNKALNIFNTSVVTPIYFTCFTTMTLISSAVLFQGFNGKPVEIITVVLGFFCIVCGVILLQVSLAAQAKSDSAVLSAELDDMHDVLSMNIDDDALNPGAASIRGALSMRRLATRKTSTASLAQAFQRRRSRVASASSSVGLPHHGSLFTRDVQANQHVNLPPPMPSLPSRSRSPSPTNIGHGSHIRFEKTLPPVSATQYASQYDIPEEYALERDYATTKSMGKRASGRSTSPMQTRHDNKQMPQGFNEAGGKPVLKTFSFARGRRGIADEESVGLFESAAGHVAATASPARSRSRSSESRPRESLDSGYIYHEGYGNRF